MALFSISEDSIRLLQSIIDQFRRRVVNTNGRDKVDWDADWPGQQSHIALVPDEGLSARNGFIPGYADCTIFQILEQGDGDSTLLDSGFQERVYNLSDVDVLAGQFIPIMRDKFGTWMVAGAGILTDTNPATALLAPSSSASGSGTLIALTPGDGVPPLYGNVPGFAQCEIYRIVSRSGLPTLQDAGFKEVVYNLSTMLVGGAQYVPISQDQFGSWLIDGACIECIAEPPSGTGTSTGTSLSHWYCITPAPTSTGTGTSTSPSSEVAYSPICLWLSTYEIDSLELAGWVVVGGPYNTQADCITECGGTSQAQWYCMSAPHEAGSSTGTHPGSAFRQCLQLTPTQLDSRLATGWVRRSGPHDTYSECLSLCGNFVGTGTSNLDKVCCPDTSVPTVLYLTSGSYIVDSWGAPPTIEFIYDNTLANPFDIGSWRADVDFTLNPTFNNLRLYCAGHWQIQSYLDDVPVSAASFEDTGTLVCSPFVCSFSDDGAGLHPWGIITE